MSSQRLYLQGIDVIVVGIESGLEASWRVCGCEQCSALAVTSFECVLDDVRPGRGAATTYVLGQSLECPSCGAPIIETTLVQLKEPRESVREANFNWCEMLLTQTEIVLIDEAALVQAQHLMSACELCGDNAQISFDYLLDAVTHCDPTQTEYLMCRRARCPRCFSEVTEKTLVIPE